MKIAAIRTDFKHHGKESGYKQVLKFMNPFKVFGLDQNVTSKNHKWWLQKYLWLYEFQLWKYRKEIDVLFIMYGEEFYRFSWRFLKKAKIVVTYHVPPDLLKMEILKGNQRGRVGQITHWLNKKRFSKIDAAIITNENQREILKLVIPDEKIHFIPLGVHLHSINEKLQVPVLNGGIDKEGRSVITVGNWLRDWEFYFEIVEAMPEVTFHLVNRNLKHFYIERTKSLSNLHYYPNIDDDRLYDLYRQVDFQFLPLTGIASSNALVQSLALGCPVLLSDSDDSGYENSGKFISTFKNRDIEDCKYRMVSLFNLTLKEKNDLSEKSISYASNYDWKNIAEKTLKVINRTMQK
jgi:glycosyltransferase involved in cell wall biosynthesis